MSVERAVSKRTVITTTEMHSAGEPLRIIESGYPAMSAEVAGRTLLDKRRFVRQHLDHLRRLIMFEPRGHYDMYGVLLVEPETEVNVQCPCGLVRVFVEYSNNVTGRVRFHSVPAFAFALGTLDALYDYCNTPSYRGPVVIVIYSRPG